jgi:Glycosyltransferase
VEIVGDGPMRQQLENRARALDVTDRVKFVGFVKDVSPFLSNSTFLAHTSDLEGCPNVVIEAMACGRAVVATDAGDIPFLVEDGKTGFVVRRGEDDEFVERLAMLISDRELCREMGEAGRTKAEQDFALPHLIEETMAAYRGAGWMDA